MKNSTPCELIFSILLQLGCESRPELDVQMSEQSGNQEFELSTSNLNRLLGLKIWRVKDRSMIWDVNLNYFNGEWITFGKVPTR